MTQQYSFVSLFAFPLTAWCLPAPATLLEPSQSGMVLEYVSPGVMSSQTLQNFHIAADIPRSKTAQWREFESKDGRFSVQFPGRPERSEQKTKTEIGYVVSVRYTVSHSERVTYDLMFNDFPKAQIASVNPQKLLDAARDSLLYQTGGRIISETHTLHSAVRARQLEIAGNNGMRYVVRLLFADNRLYQLLLASRHPVASDARRFFDSFSLNAHKVASKSGPTTPLRG